MDNASGGNGPTSVTLNSPVKIAGPLQVALQNGLNLGNGIKLQYDKGRFIQETASRIFASTSFFDFDDNGKIVIKKDSQVNEIAKRSYRYAKILGEVVFGNAK